MRKSKKNGVQVGLRRIISECRTGVGMDCLFEVGLITFIIRSVEVLVMGSGIDEGR